MSKDETVEIFGEVETETDSAWLFSDGATTAWLPKSQCGWDEDQQIMTVPEWLATKAGFA